MANLSSPSNLMQTSRAEWSAWATQHSYTAPGSVHNYRMEIPRKCISFVVDLRVTLSKAETREHNMGYPFYINVSQASGHDIPSLVKLWNPNSRSWSFITRQWHALLHGSSPALERFSVIPSMTNIA
jgi:hypothetical protein